MAATTSVLQAPSVNRRSRVRHKVQTPAYASFTESTSPKLDLHEIVDISEDGVAIQCHSPLEVDQRIDLCLDLADCPEHIYTTGRVIWSNASGRAAVHFSALPKESLARLREWLFVNVMAGVANGEVDLTIPFDSRNHPAPRPNYTDTLAAVTAVQRQVEALGSDLSAALPLIAERARALVRASGAAIALAHSDPDFMVCRASSGADAPPVGARLHVASGFSGQCVTSGKLLLCNDTETDDRVDRESCRALGLRSILAAPIRVGEKSVGLIEAFSPQPHAFSETDGKVLLRLAETVLDAANCAARAENLPPLGPAPVEPFAPPQGSVLFAAADEEKKSKSAAKSASFGLPRSYLILLTISSATIALALGFLSAPLIQSDALPWLRAKFHARPHSQLQTVLASTEAPKSVNTSRLSVETATLDQLRQMAEQGDAAAENSLGLRYAQGDGVKLNEQEAVHWFIMAAEHGNVAAQSKLGSIYFSGRGVPQNLTQAYLWMVIASLSGDEASKTLSPMVRDRLTRAQVTSIELEADKWLRRQRESAKPASAQSKPLLETSKM